LVLTGFDCYLLVLVCNGLQLSFSDCIMKLDFGWIRFESLFSECLVGFLTNTFSSQQVMLDIRSGDFSCGKADEVLKIRVEWVEPSVLKH